MFIFLGVVSQAQEKEPDQIRVSIYEAIIKDLQSLNPTYPIKQFEIDPTINVFEKVELTSSGINYYNPSYKADLDFCNSIDDVSCVNKYSIDNFRLTKVLQNHKDNAYTDYFGLYAPLDHWFQFTSALFQNLLQNKKSTTTAINIPVKHVYFKNAEEIINHYMYKIVMDENFKIIKNQRINL